MNLVKIKEYQSVKAISKKDDYRLREDINALIIIPGEIEVGSKWYIDIFCNCCKKRVQIGCFYGSSQQIIGFKLDSRKLKEKDLIQFNEMFELDILKVRNSGTDNSPYYLAIKGIGAWVTFYKCNVCESKYLMVYSKKIGEERPPAPNIINLNKFWNVDFDESELGILISNYTNS